MTEPVDPPAPAPPDPAPLAADPAAFSRALGVAAATLIALDWLLGTLLWLPFFGGLLGFFVEGLIAGGVAFRVARAARPISRARLWRGIILLVVISMTATLFFEYWHFTGRVSRPPYFPTTRNKALAGGNSDEERRAALANVGDRAVDAFRNFLAENYPPGGMVGYAQWATRNGIVNLSLDDERQRIEAEHRGWVWPLRTVIGALLLALGLSLAFDALKSPTPVRNVLRPDEEYEEIDD